MSCRAWSALVRWGPSSSAAIVTQLVTQAAFFSGKLLADSASARKRSASAANRCSATPQKCQPPFPRCRDGSGQPGRLAPQPRRLLLEVLRVFLCITTGHDTPLPRTSRTMREPDRLLKVVSGRGSTCACPGRRMCLAPSGVPVVVVKARSVSCQRDPAASRSAAWSACHSLSAPTAIRANFSAWRDLGVFVSPLPS